MAPTARTHLHATTAVARFAHLLGIHAPKPAAAAPARAEDEPKKEDDVAAAAPAADAGDEVDCPDCDGTGEMDDGSDCETCDGTGKVPGEGAKKGKKAKTPKAEDDDTDKEKSDEEMSDDEDEAKAATAGRAFERARCAAIFAAPAAAVRPDLAAHLAFNTGMSAKAAVDLLTVTATGQKPARAERPPARPRVDLGDSPAAPTGAKGLAAQIVAAGKKRRGEA